MSDQIGPLPQELRPLSSVESRWRSRARRGIIWCLVGVGAVAVGISLWVRRTFGVISIDQLLSNLTGGGDGAGGSGIVVNAVVTGVLVPIALVAILALLVSRSLRGLREHGILRGARERWLRWGSAVLAVAIAVAGVGLLGATVGACEFVQAIVREAGQAETIADYYAAPELPVPLAEGAAAENLILIYLESIEDAFADDEVFEKNMLAPIEQATTEWESIPRLRQYTGGGWTMSGLVSTQCGIPLRSASATGGAAELNELGLGNPVSAYLPGATCLGDVLQDAGYTSVFLGGADAAFAGKSEFLRSHGTEVIRDLPYWRSLDETEIRDDWGLSDRRLFERARDAVLELRAAGDPYALTMLTLDTHEGPRVYEYCEWDTEVAMTSITFCSMQQVAGFVDFLEAEGVLEDTTVVVMGDHQKMLAQGGSFWEEMRGEDDRTIFNRIWSPQPITVRADEIDQFSMYPTILELLGFQPDGHRAGLGVSALAEPASVPPGSPRDLAEADYEALVQSRSVEFYRELWTAQRTTGAS